MCGSALTILHVDMDAFYASVEQRDRPELRGLPVIVGGVGGRGVVCAASYEARPFGVHSAMPMATARRLCPQAIVLPVRMSHYAEISGQIREILLSFTPLVEPLSLDEAFLDVRGCQELFGSSQEIARKIKSRIKAETGLTASVGVATNKFLAKLAGDLGKPDGLVEVPADSVADFLSPLSIGRIWGIGKQSEKRLHALGIQTIGHLASLPEQILVDHFGEAGRHAWKLAHGRDDRTVVPDREAKSISTERTFAEDIGDLDLLRNWLLDLTEQLAGRLRHAGLRTRTLELKIRSSDFQTWHRARSVSEPSNVTNILRDAALEIFDRSLTPRMLPIRLLGVGATRLSRAAPLQGDLFDSEHRKRQQSLDQTVDAIRGQFGSGAVQRGNSLNRKEESGG